MTTLNPEVQPREVLLIDLSAIFRMCWHASENGPVSGALQSSMQMVRKAIGDGNARAVAIACDGKNNFRKTLDPTYKAQRERAPDLMYGQLDELKDQLRNEGLLLWEFETFEADDVIATATAAAVKAGHPVMINTPDKDLLQLMSPGVRCMRTHTWTEVGEMDVIEKFGVTPRQLGDLLALIGDKSDNIAGIEGVGPKGAAGLIATYGTIETIFDALKNRIEDVCRAFPRFAKPLRAFAASIHDGTEKVTVGRELVALRYDVPLRFEEIFEKREAKPLTTEDDFADFADDARDDIPISGPAPALVHQAENARRTAAALDAAVGLAADAPKPNVTPTPAPSVAQSSLTAPAPETSLVRQQAEDARRVALSEFGSDLQPTGMNGLWWLAKRVVESRNNKFKNEHEVLMVMLRGKDFGLTPAASADIFHVIEGKPCPPASVLIARAKAHPDCEYFQCVEADDTHAKWITKNKKNKAETVVVFTIEQAMLAGLAGRNTWKKHPEDMLVKTAGAKLARREYPDSTLGSYAFEEMDAA